MSERPLCSVVIPSHYRPESLARVLEALAHQTVPAERFEIIVVLDGASPPSRVVAEAFRRARPHPALDVLEQAPSGQAEARNHGAAAARAPVIVFLDDDVVPEPDLVEAHLRHHRAGERVAVLGDSRFVRGGSYYHLLSWAWWEDLFAERTLPDRPPHLADFCAGNVSLRRDDFFGAGGFDRGFTGYGGEDYELGYRLLRSGVRFVADRGARAAHHHEATIAGVLRKTRQEAHGDLLLARKHPELHGTVRMTAPLRWPITLVARTALDHPRLGDLATGAVARLLPVLERFGMRHAWLRGFKAVRTYAYWRGVREAVGGWDELQRFRAETPARASLALDVTDGLRELPPIPAAGAELTVTARGRTLGTVVLDAAPRESARRHVARRLAAELGDELVAVLPAGARPWWMQTEGPTDG